MRIILEFEIPQDIMCHYTKTVDQSAGSFLDSFHVAIRDIKDKNRWVLHSSSGLELQGGYRYEFSCPENRHLQVDSSARNM